MSTRRILIGCGIAGAALILVVVVAGIAGYRILTAPAPMPPAESLVGDDAVGYAVVNLSPDDPWIADLVASLGRFSPQGARADDIFPARAVWSATPGTDGSLDHAVALSLSPKGRLVGMVIDGALWKAGRSGEGGLSREEYGGEGITLFPRTTGPPAHVFVRGNTLVWASGPGAARRSIDLMNAAAGGSTGRRSGLPSLLPDDRAHALAGAVDNSGGSLASVLAALPAASLQLPGDSLAPVAGVSFTFDPVSEDEGAGSIVIRFREGTPDDVCESITGMLASGAQGIAVGGLTIQADPIAGAQRGTIAVTAVGLASAGRWLAERAIAAGGVLEQFR